MGSVVEKNGQYFSILGSNLYATASAEFGKDSATALRNAQLLLKELPPGYITLLNDPARVIELCLVTEERKGGRRYTHNC